MTITFQSLASTYSLIDSLKATAAQAETIKTFTLKSLVRGGK